MIQKKWTLNPPDRQLLDKLQQELGINHILCGLLIQKGIHTYEQAKHFFRPSLEDLHDPFLMKDMDKAVSRLTDAIDQEEKILLYGDYDVDGTTCVAMAYQFLTPYSDQLHYYLPDRYKEGYGLSKEGIEYARQHDIGLIIAMDCGITALESVALANKYGIDIIICDHHLPKQVRPDACAILDPKQQDCEYPYKELSGCGVVFKYLQAYAQARGIDMAECYHLLDYLLLSIACDIVPITGENRILAFEGLRQINTKNASLGVKILIEKSGKSLPVSIGDLVFGAGPMLNAAGRIADARGAVKLLLATHEKSAQALADALAYQNTLRKDYDRQIVEDANHLLQKLPHFSTQKSLVLHQAHWHKGVVGIAAARLVEQYHRPTIILTTDGEQAVGSARSVQGFDIHEAISACSHHLTNFGGHRYAAGLSLPLESLQAFRADFERVVSSRITEAQKQPILSIAARIRLVDITPSFWRILKQFAPFGPSNRRPVFLSENLSDDGNSRLLKGNHLLLSVKEKGGTYFKGIAFGQGGFLDIVKTKNFSLCYVLEEEHHEGKTHLRLNVRDIRSTS